jgi:solute carrier family 12 (potassium/chloride transporters), member 8
LNRLVSAFHRLLIFLITANDFQGWFNSTISNNTWSNYEEGYSWFKCFGVFFPTITGILAGINMSGDLKNPSLNIPNGSLAAIGTG